MSATICLVYVVLQPWFDLVFFKCYFNKTKIMFVIDLLLL